MLKCSVLSMNHKFMNNYKMKPLSSLQVVCKPTTFEILKESEMENNDMIVYVK